MLKLLSRALILAPAIGTGGAFGTVLVNYGFELMQKFGLLLVVAVGFWVAFWLFGIQRLQNAQNKTWRSIGEGLGAGFLYTAIFQGLIYTVMVFWIVGIATGQGEIPEGQSQFISEFIVGSGYLSVFIFGATGATILFTYYRPLKRACGLVLAAVGVGLPIYLLVIKKQVLATFLTDSPQHALMETLLYYLVFSILSMAILGGAPPDEDYRKVSNRKAKLKKKLRSKT